METKITNIGWETAINQGKTISIMLDSVQDTSDMKTVNIEVEHDDFGTPYVPADRVVELLKLLAKEMQNYPLQNLYIVDKYNY